VVLPPSANGTLAREVCEMPHWYLRSPLPLQRNHARRNRSRRDVRRLPGLMCVKCGCDATIPVFYCFERIVVLVWVCLTGLFMFVVVESLREAQKY
jgi:hypothetical protein